MTASEAPAPDTGSHGEDQKAPADSAMSDSERRSGRERRGIWRPSHGWRSRDIIRATMIVLVIYWLLHLIWFTNQLVLVSFLGVLFGLAVSAGVDQLQRRLHIPRGLGAFIVVFGFLAILAGFFAWSGPALAAQSRELKSRLPQVLDDVDAWIARNGDSVVGGIFLSGGATVVTPQDSAAAAPPTTSPAVAQTSADDGRPPTMKERILSQLGGVTRYLFPFLTSTVAVLAGVLLVVFLAIYVAVAPRTYHTGLMHLFPHDARERAGEVLSAIAVVLRKWLVAQLIAMVVIGVVSTVVLLLLGVPAALPLGVLAGLLEFVPTVGPILSAVPAIAMGFVDSPEKALWVAVAYWGIQFLENQLLIPILMSETVDVPPALTILAQALMAVLFGFLGLLVAVPLLAASMVAVRMLYVEGVVGDDIEVLAASES